MNSPKYYDPLNNRLVFVGQKADPSFWDRCWEKPDLKQEVERIGQKQNFVTKTTLKYLNPYSSKILEGGCGQGHFVYALSRLGFEAYGIDFAPKTINQLQILFPNLRFSLGNVETISFPNDFFDGYWSLGVIEHFYGGFEKVSSEMARVIKNRGYLFLTFPYLSPLRKLKIFFHRYLPFEEKKFDLKNFYQFALDDKQVIKNFKLKRFDLKYKRPLDGVNGLKEEIEILSPVLSKIYSSRFFPVKILRFILNKLISRFCGHIIFLVFQKNED